MESKIKLTAVKSLMEEAMLKCQYCRYQNICIEMMRLNCIESVIKEHYDDEYRENTYINHLER